jgi:SAM-dependent methyltransferase
MEEKAIQADLEYFIKRWEGKRGKSVGHSPAIWDDRADEWIAELEAEPEYKTARALDTATYLRRRGLLTKDSSVVDIGCGPGLFAAEFAKTAGSALGVDYSRRFVEYAGEKALEAGLTNARFECYDFVEEDTSRYDGGFDLAFSSITPATCTWERMQKFMRLTRAYCCNVSFVKIKDQVAEQISRDLFGETFRPRWDGSGFYALLNIIWLLGYYPETHYYDDVRTDPIAATREEAEYFAQLCCHNDKGDVDKVVQWLEEHKETQTKRETRYGLILWDVRRKDER